MNNERRNTIATLIKELEDLRDAARDLQNTADDIRDRIEMVRQEEQDYFDNMPESFQGGDKGQAAEEAVQSLDTALDQAQEAVTSLESAADCAGESVDALNEIE